MAQGSDVHVGIAEGDGKGEGPSVAEGCENSQVGTLFFSASAKSEKQMKAKYLYMVKSKICRIASCLDRLGVYGVRFGRSCDADG